MIVIILAVISYSQLFAQDLYPINNSDNKWGYIDEYGDVKIQPVFDSVNMFYEGFAAVMLNDYWGYIDNNGKVSIKVKFHEAFPFNEGLALVKKDSLYGYIDTKGEYIIQPIFQNALSFNEGKACVKNQKGVWNIIDTIGEMILHNLEIDINCNECFGSGYQPFYYSGVIQIPNQRKNETYYYNAKGKIIKNNKIQSISHNEFSEGLMPYINKEKIGYINTSGKVKIKAEYSVASYFRDSIAWVIKEDLDSNYLLCINKSSKVISSKAAEIPVDCIIFIYNYGNNTCIFLLKNKNSKLEFAIFHNNDIILEGIGFNDFISYPYENRYPKYKKANKLLLIKDGSNLVYYNLNGQIVWKSNNSM